MEPNDEDLADRPFLIVTGSSAGGIEPLCTFLAALPPDFPAPVVVAQHLPPAHDTRLPEIVAARSALPAQLVGERSELLPGHIYIVGPDLDVDIVDEHAVTVAIVRRGPKPSIDRLFASAARTHGDRCVAVIFSGLGQDGLAGARSVKEFGGTVLVQDPQSAHYPSMPNAIPPTLLDVVAPPEAMGALLVGLIAEARGPHGPSEQSALRTLLQQVRDRTGIDFSQYKTPTIMRRLARLMVANGVASIVEFTRYLQQHPETYNRIAGAFLIKVTEFFRDAALFDELKLSVLPQLFEHARETTGEVRIWSAGTSTGEEAYSLAMLCAEALRDDVDDLSIRIFATDVDETAIAFARRGVYPAESLRHVPAVWKERYFTALGDAYEVSKRIRNMTVFGQHDLGQRSPFPRIDLVLCRNVLIYFTRELQARALQLFAFSLRDRGFLVLGKSESTSILAEYFRPLHNALKVYERHGERILLPPSRLLDGAAPLAAESGPGLRAAPGVEFALGRDVRSSTDGLWPFLDGAPIGVVIVDRRYDIVAINAAARAIFDIHGVGIGEDFLHLAVSVDALRLRELIDAALRREAAPPAELAIASDDGSRWLQISCLPDRPAPGRRSNSVAVVAVDVTDVAAQRRRLELQTNEQAARLAEIESRLETVSRRTKALLQANDELSAANGELRGVNEQLLISIEEAASANEEIETLNEEMQATNEELETLNEELQATVEELNTTNDELAVRSLELERVSEAREFHLRSLEREREALRAVLQLDGLPFALVDRTGIVTLDPTAETLLIGRRPDTLVEGATFVHGGTTYAVAIRNAGDGTRLVSFHPTT